MATTRLCAASILVTRCLLLTSLCYVTVAAGLSSLEQDFRYISYKDMQASTRKLELPDVQDYSRLVFDLDRHQIIAGATDNLLRLSLDDLGVLQRSKWPASAQAVQTCLDKGQSEVACRNHIRVLLMTATAGVNTGGAGEAFVCGTHAYAPLCQWRKLDDIDNALSEKRGVGMCPYSPSANTTALLTSSSTGGAGSLYAGAPMDFSGQDSAIYRSTPGNNNNNNNGDRAATGSGQGQAHLRTHQYDPKWLNDPQFVGSFEDEDFVYFMFREAAVEYINCGKIIYSRIGRVCKSDSGGQLMLKDNWTTFLKARLNCSRPGEYPFYYDEIQGMAYDAAEDAVYATFTTPRNSIAGSAICAFSMSAVRDAFSGPFKHQATPGSAWESRQAEHHSCSQTRGSLQSSRYQLMDRAVQPHHSQPLHQASLERYSHIALDSLDTRLHVGVRLMYVATTSVDGDSGATSVGGGMIKKIAVLPRTGTACVVEMFQPAEPSVGLTGLYYVRETNSLYVTTTASLLRVMTSHCSRHTTRDACLSAMDPHCGWNHRHGESGACTTAPQGNPLHQAWEQSVTECPRLQAQRDGGWGAWGPWEQCLNHNHNNGAVDVSTYKQQHGRHHQHHHQSDGSGGHDTCQCQTRHCDNPRPQGGGATCRGSSVRVANCTQHGAWTAWSDWSACSQSCGMAVKTRRRTCGNPAPAHGGRVCVGPDINEIYCTGNPPCAATSTTTTTTTSAAAAAAVDDDNRNRQGAADDKRQTNDDESGSWTVWSGWSSCSAACGGGYRLRRRSCAHVAGSASTAHHAGAGGGATGHHNRECRCHGGDIEYQMCNEHACQEHRKFSAWTQWTPVTGNDSSGDAAVREEHRFRYLCRAPAHPAHIRLSGREERRACDPVSGCASDGARGALSGKGCETGAALRVAGAPLGATIVALSCCGAFLLGASCAGGVLLARRIRDVRRKRRRGGVVVGSPHYVTQSNHHNHHGNRTETAKQNSYVSVPLRDISVKRQPSFTGKNSTLNRSTNTSTLGKSNNVTGNHCMTPKLYPKAICNEYTATQTSGGGNPNAAANGGGMGGIGGTLKRAICNGVGANYNYASGGGGGTMNNSRCRRDDRTAAAALTDQEKFY